MIAEVWRDIIRLVRSWWLRDRIRASPREGALLRIEPGDFLRIGDIEAAVVARVVVEKPSGVALCLTCCTRTGPAQLEVGITVDGELSPIVWNENDSDRNLLPHDLEVWPRTHRIEGPF